MNRFKSMRFLIFVFSLVSVEAVFLQKVVHGAQPEYAAPVVRRNGTGTTNNLNWMKSLMKSLWNATGGRVLPDACNFSTNPPEGEGPSDNPKQTTNQANGVSGDQRPISSVPVTDCFENTQQQQEVSKTRLQRTINFVLVKIHMLVEKLKGMRNSGVQQAASSKDGKETANVYPATRALNCACSPQSNTSFK
jgi:hypothetical protein